MARLSWAEKRDTCGCHGESHMRKYPNLIVHRDNPFNAEPSLEALCQSPVTPVDLFFIRNHGDVPSVDPAAYRLSIENTPRLMLLSLNDLQHRFAKVTVEATLQCAGNRRQELMAIQPIPGELDWDVAAISNTSWSGVRLRDVLQAAGIDPTTDQQLFVAFEGLDETERHNQHIYFGGSIPIDKALSPEVILAYEMSGEPLSPVHGFPLRVVVPGYIGARSVKWLRCIKVQAMPSENYFQSHSYKLFAPNVTSETVDWDVGLMLGEMAINAMICWPHNGMTIPAGAIEVRGYAITGGNRHVARVDVSIDGGQSWITADLLGNARPWTWRFWKAQLNLTPGEHQLIVRAVDSAANTQPEDARSIWNFKGYMNNARHRVTVTVT
jgi:sulfite oxidase